MKDHVVQNKPLNPKIEGVPLRGISIKVTPDGPVPHETERRSVAVRKFLILAIEGI